MADTILFAPIFQIEDANGNPLAGAKLWFFQAGTINDLTTYQDSAGATPHANPVVADASGLFPAIYMTGNATFKTELTTSAGSVIQTIDNITARSAFASGTLAAPGISFVGDPDTGFYRIGANSFGAVAGGALAALFDANGLTVKDALFRIVDDADGTKIAKFQASGITTATTRTYILPDSNGTLALSGASKGTDVASATTISLGTGSYFHITGSTGPVTDIDFASPEDGREATLIFDSTPTITHNATTLALPGGANIVAAAGDRMIIRQDSSDNIVVVDFIRAAGVPAYTNVEDQTLTGGARVTSKDLGTPTAASTVTLDPGDRPLQHLTNNAAFILAPGSNSGSLLLDITNGATAGAITTSGWTKVTGAFTTTNGNKFRCSCSIGNAGSLLSIQALQ